MDSTPCVFVDGAFKNGIGAVGGVLISNNQVWLSWCKYLCTCSSVEYVQANAIHEGIIKAKQLNLQRVNILTDSLKLCNAFARTSEPRTDWWLLLTSSLYMSQNIYVLLDHIPRNNNKIAHKLAKLGFCTKSSFVCGVFTHPNLYFLYYIYNMFCFKK